jgi:glucose/arabinose dehydrogenase
MRTALLGLALALFLAAPAAAAPKLVLIGDDFDRPMYVTSPPGDTQLYVVEKGGTIKLLGGGTFLDISDQVLGSDEERGLLSMAFARDYKTSGKFYVFYTAVEDDPGDIRIVEYRRSPNPSKADPNSARPVYSTPHAQGFHNGGQLQIGPDGMLYVSIGDNGESAKAGTTDNPYGKILRLNPAGGAAPGNPFGNVVWAYGLRNPWRFSFDRTTGDIAIGDVGSDPPQAREEINWGTAPGRASGVNFGWPDGEGMSGPGQHPIIEHNHDTFQAIVGGYVIRDQGLPTLRGRYIYGDFADQRLFSAIPRSGADDKPTGLVVRALTSFGEDACGHIYAASFNGQVYRLQDGAISPCSFNGQATDTTPPGLAVGLAGVRKLLKKRVLRIGVRCSEACQVSVGTRLRKVRRLATRHRSLAANQRKVVRVKLSKALTRKLRKRVRRRGFVRIAVNVRATDAAGNVATKTKRGRIKRR